MIILKDFIRNFSEMTEINFSVYCRKSNQCPNSDGNEYGDLYQSLKCPYIYHMDHCNGIMTLGFSDVSYMSVLMTLMELTGMCFMVG